MKKRLSQQPFFIFLLPLFYLLNTLNDYYPLLKAGDLVHTLSLLVMGISILLYLLLQFIVPKSKKYIFLVLYLQIIYFFFGTLHLFLKTHFPIIAHYKYLLPLLALTGIIIFLCVRRSNPEPSRSFLYLNTVLLLFIGLEISTCIIKHGNNNRSGIWTKSKRDPVMDVIKCDTCLKPDIFFMIFDGYAGSRTLKDHWGFDNGDLYSFLVEKGFYYADRSRSNYNFTPYSIGSILNMDFHASIPEDMDFRYFSRGISTIKFNRVCQILRENNYKIINQSFFPLPYEKPGLDISYVASKNLLLSQTLPHKFNKDIAWNFPWLKLSFPMKEAIALKRIQFEQITKAHALLLETSTRKHDQPVFVYTHFLAPHDPYFRDSTGKVTPDSSWINIKYSKESYLSYLKYTNTIIKDVVTHLRSEGNRPRVIIIQSDHGYRNFLDNAPPDLEFDNLNAIYFPDGDYSKLYDSMSSINTFPILFNKYFDATLPMKRDSSIYIPH